MCSLTAAAVLAAAMAPVAAREIAWHAAAPATVSDAKASLDTRRGDVIDFNACGREEQFTAFVQLQRQGDFSKQGEGTSAILAAKIARATTGCRYTEAVGVNDRQLTPAESLCAVRGRDVDASGVTRLTTVIGPVCLRQQINTALLTYRHHDQAGSTGVPCLPLVSGGDPFASDYSLTTVGEYDVDLAHILRLYYLAPRGTLDDATRNHFWNELLTLRGGPALDSYSPIYDCGNRDEDLGSPEHYADQEDGASGFLEDLGDLGEYLLKRLFLIVLFYYTGGLVEALTDMIPLVPTIGIPPALGLVTDVLDPFVAARIPETENHRMLIESSRYLTNQAMLDELRQNGSTETGDIERQQRDTRDWLLKRMQGFAMNDFDEYNARAYQRYSLLALTNLYDFAEDEHMRDAAHIVLDYASAKAVAGSSLGRRFAPFRRLSENDGYQAANPGAAYLYNRVKGSDFGAARLLVLAGTTGLESTPHIQTLLATQPGTIAFQSPLYAGEYASDGGAGGFDDLVVTATSGYTLPDPILEAAVARTPFTQQIRHGGAEAYSAGASYLISAGGLTSGPANSTYGFGRDADRGVAMPTTLMLTDEGLTVFDLLRFDATGIGIERAPNLCVARGFACGVNPVVPQNIADCGVHQSAGGTDWLFVDSAAPGCNFFDVPAADARRHHFYLALATRACADNPGGCGSGHPDTLGLLDIVDAPSAVAPPDAAFDAFRASRPGALDWQGGNEGRYTTSEGHLIEFTMPVFPARAGPLLPSAAVLNGTVRSIDGVAQPTGEFWPFLASGGLINAAHDGVITIGPPGGTTLKLDLHDWTAPAWNK